MQDKILNIKNIVQSYIDKSDKRRLRMLNDISCLPSCSGCCSRLIPVSIAEAIIIYQDLKESGRWSSIRSKCEELLPVISSSNQVSWFKMNIPCIFLQNNLCTVYKIRPASCFTHFSKSHPSLCGPWSQSEGEFKPIDYLDLHAEMLNKISDVSPGNNYLIHSAPFPVSLLMAERLVSKTGVSLETAILGSQANEM
jgi:Fe-S-cluster containining protein